MFSVCEKLAYVVSVFMNLITGYRYTKLNVIKIGLDWARFNVPLDTFYVILETAGWVTAASARIVDCCQSPRVCSVYVYYLKGIVSVCFRCQAIDCGFFRNTPLLVYLQPTKLSDAQALPTSWLGGSTRGAYGGHCARRRSICYP